MNFIDSAYERLAKVTPELVKYVASFVDLSQEVPENSGIELGVFVIVSGNELFYIPVISKGGTLYPIDSIFTASDSMFFPLTPKMVDKIIFTNEVNLGQATRIPPQVVKNPNVRELVEPPKTGKYMYASNRLPEFLSQLPEHTKKALLTKLASDVGLARGLKDVGMDLSEIKDSLAPVQEKVAEAQLNIGIKVITEGAGLPDDIVQQILQRGYGFVGYNSNPTFAVEYDARNDGYTTLMAAQPGNVYEIIMKDGTTKVGFVPPKYKALQKDSITKNDKTDTGHIMEVQLKANKPYGTHPMMICENGDFIVLENPVIKATTMGTLEGVLSTLAENGRVVDAEKITKPEGCYCFRVLLLTPSGWTGPFEINRISRSEVGTVIIGKTWDYENVTIHVSPNMHGNLRIEGRDVFVNSKAAFLVLKDDVSRDVETIPSVAALRRNMMYTNHLAPIRISYDGLEYAINGQRVGTELDLAKELVERKGIDKHAFEVFKTKAAENSFVDVYMSKEAAATSGPMSDPTSFMAGMPTGPSFNPSENPMPNRSMEGQVDVEGVKQSLMTGDKSIVESTIISEFLNDPNMFETISGYLPDIKESIDKLGRTLFLLRLNVGTISSTIEPEYLSTLMSSLRNTYKMLGENYIRLENLSGTPIVGEHEL